MLIIRPLPITTTPSISGVTGSGAANLLTPSPKEAWIAQSVGTSIIDIDLGANTEIDSIFLGSTNAAAGATWSIERGTGLGTGLTALIAAGTPFRHPESPGPRHHGFAHLGASVTGRYFRIAITQTDTAPLFAGTLVIGRAFTAPYEYGAGRIAIDTGAREALQDGGFGIGDGVVKAGFRWTFAGLSTTQVNALWTIAIDRGERRPVLVVEGAEGEARRNEELHYGLFDSFEAYEREAPEATRWSLSMTEWT